MTIEESGAEPLGHDAPLADMLTRMGAASTGARVSLGTLVQAVGARSFVPVMLVPALLLVSPLSGIPLFSSLCGIVTALLALQFLLGFRRPWLPAMLLRREVDAARLRAALDWLTVRTGPLDRMLRPRLRLLSVPPLDRLPALGCLVCGLAIPFFELVPFSATILGVAITFFLLAALTRDGIFFLLALGVMGFAAKLVKLVFVAVT